MKNSYCKLLSIILSVVLFLLPLSSCSASSQTTNSSSSRTTDYANETIFESALNNGENVSGKTVKFHADALHPESRFGYNIWSGDHLNFISDGNPGIKRGDTAIVQVKSTEQLDNNSWLIYYELLDVEKSNATSSTSTITSSSSRTPVTKTQSLQLTDTGIYLNTSYLWDDIAYIYYVGLVYNPNSEKVAFSPKLIATAKNKDGTILATDEQSCGVIMPGDTVPIMGSFSVLRSELSDDSYVSYQIECNDFRNDSLIYSSAKTSDFVTSHISEHSGSRNHITGEVTNHFSEDCTMLKIVALLKKNGKIVGAESTYMSTLNSNQTKAFEIESLSDFQDHDSLEVIVVPTL